MCGVEGLLWVFEWEVGEGWWCRGGEKVVQVLRLECFGGRDDDMESEKSNIAP